MKRKKWMVAATTAVLAAGMLAGCGASEPSSTPVSGSGNVNVNTNNGTLATTAEKMNVGKFDVTIPAGWAAFPQTDIFGEQQDDGSFPIDPAQILIAKGVTDEFDAYSEANVRIYWKSPQAISMDSRDYYEDVKELENVQINGVACDAFEGTSLGYTYQFINYNPGDAQYEIQILISVDGKATGETYESADVKQILESIKGAAGEEAAPTTNTTPEQGQDAITEDGQANTPEVPADAPAEVEVSEDTITGSEQDLSADQTAAEEVVLY